MKYTTEQIAAALALLKATGSPAKVIELLGYPSNPMLYHWRNKYPEYYVVPNQRHWKKASPELKQSIISRCISDGESVKSISQETGYSESLIYRWLREFQRKGHISVMKKPSSATPEDINSAEDIKALKAQMLEMQMEIDILRETLNVIKKDPGVDLTTLKNREKAVIVGALRNDYSLPSLLKRMKLSKSSFYYQTSKLKATEKYIDLRKHVNELFIANRSVYGYRRIHSILRNEGTTVSEKIVRRIMREAGLDVKQKRKKKYNSYKGEITPAAENVINRDFHADHPNEKWLTDITEFSIKSGKVYLSPKIDCFDGMPVEWSIGTVPDSELANSMLRKAIEKLQDNEKPIVHSDRGCHYRWPEWIRIMEKAGLTRSMSKKGCSPDNSACEGFFGHLKTELFYGHNWDNYSTTDFIRELNSYLVWYCNDRIKTTLGGISPLEYRRRMGLAV